MEPENYTLEGLINAERDFLLAAGRDRGAYFTHAVQMVTLLNNMVESIDRPTRYLFVAFLSHVKKHVVLALFSAARRHHVQSHMNLRQVLEATAWAAYALAQENLDLFREQVDGRAEVPRRLSDTRNLWLTEHYPIKSEGIRRLKDQINKTVAHASVVYALQTFDLGPEERPGFRTSFFDAEDDFSIKTDLLMIANIAMGAIQVFEEVNQKEGVFRFPVNFVAQFQDAMREHDRLRAEVRAHDRFRPFVE